MSGICETCCRLFDAQWKTWYMWDRLSRNQRETRLLAFAVLEAVVGTALLPCLQMACRVQIDDDILNTSSNSCMDSDCSHSCCMTSSLRSHPGVTEVRFKSWDWQLDLCVHKTHHQERLIGLAWYPECVWLRPPAADMRGGCSISGCHSMYVLQLNVSYFILRSVKLKKGIHSLTFTDLLSADEPMEQTSVIVLHF